MEEELATGLCERQVAELVEDDEMDEGEAIGDATLAANLDLGLELADQADGDKLALDLLLRPRALPVFD